MHTLDKGDQWIHMRVHKVDTGASFCLTIVYGFNTSVERGPMWRKLHQIVLSINEPWLIKGDFNSLLNFADKQGGQPVLPGDLMDFRECVAHCKVQDMLSNEAFLPGPIANPKIDAYIQRLTVLLLMTCGYETFLML